MTPEQFESIRAYVGFSETASRRLATLLPHVHPHAAAIVDDFYAAIQAHPGAVAAITGGQAQVERLKGTLIRWLDSVLRGPHDVAYLESHSRIGRVHVHIDLPQEYMFTAMNRIRQHLLEVADASFPPGTGELRATKTAVNQILDIELAIMLDTYREDLVAKMRIREQLATLGQLSATIAHELRNPLGTIESSLFLLKRRLEKLKLTDESVQKHHEKIAAQVRECTTIIQNLLDLARDRPLKKRSFPVSDLVSAALDGLAVPETVRITVSVAEGLEVVADHDQLKSALSNLLRNSLDALRAAGGGNVAVEAERDGMGVHVDVRDDGPGIPADLRQKVFDVLFTTKSSGTGLGLALARRICQAHGGKLSLEPSPRGAHLRIWVPG